MFGLRGGWGNDSLGLTVAPAIAVLVIAAPVSAVVTNSRRVTLRDMRRMLNRTGGKGNETDHNQKVPEERFGVGLLNVASVIAMLRLLGVRRLRRRFGVRRPGAALARGGLAPLHSGAFN